MPKNLEFTERLSYISASSKHEDKENNEYNMVKTPNDLENGALRPGREPQFTDRDVLALLAQYFTVGLLYGIFPTSGPLYPILVRYCNLEGYQVNSAGALIGIGWTMKAFIGMLSDCVPIRGLRRKPYMILGWILCTMFLLILGFMKHGDPYYLDSSLRLKDPANYTEDDMKYGLNPSAIDAGTKIAIFSALATFSFIIADVPSDALMVEYAQREPIATRGRIQTAVYGTRALSGILSLAMLAFLTNGPDYGGTFTWSISINAFFIILAVPCILILPITYLFIQDAPQPPLAFRSYMKQNWDLLQTPAMCQIITFLAAYNFLNYNTPTPMSYIKSTWSEVTPLTSSITSMIGNLLFAATCFATGKWGATWNWRFIIIVTTFGSNILDALVNFLTIYGVVRNQWFYVGVPIAEQLPQGVNFMVLCFVCVELADMGNEGIVYGLLTTIQNLPQNFGPMITNVIDSQLDVQSDAMKHDDLPVRNRVAACYGIYYGQMILSLFFLVYLPRQKQDVQRLKQKGGKNPTYGALILILSFVSFVLSLTSSLMSMFESTSCYVFAGGPGCS